MLWQLLDTFRFRLELLCEYRHSLGILDFEDLINLFTVVKVILCVFILSSLVIAYSFWRQHRAFTWHLNLLNKVLSTHQELSQFLVTTSILLLGTNQRFFNAKRSFALWLLVLGLLICINYNVRLLNLSLGLLLFVLFVLPWHVIRWVVEKFVYFK